MLDFSHKTALVFGNEKCGVSSEMSELSDGDFTIPMVCSPLPQRPHAGV